MRIASSVFLLLVAFSPVAANAYTSTGPGINSGNVTYTDVINGNVTSVSTYGDAKTQIVQNANVSYFYAYDQSAVTVSGGQLSWLFLHNNATAEVAGGDISWLWAYDDSHVILSGADNLSWLVLSSPASSVEIFANNVTYNSGHLSGTWGSGANFSFWAVNDPFTQTDVMPTNIHISAAPVPEPSIPLLMALGVLIIILSQKIFHSCHCNTSLFRTPLPSPLRERISA